MKVTDNNEFNSVILEAEEGMRLTDKNRKFYAKRIEARKDCIDMYEEVYYNDKLAMEVDERPSENALTEEQMQQIKNIQDMMNLLQSQLNDILK